MQDKVIRLYNTNIGLIDEILFLFSTDFLKLQNESLIRNLEKQKQTFLFQLETVSDDACWNKFSSEDISNLVSLLEKSIENNTIQLYFSNNKIKN